MTIQALLLMYHRGYKRLQELHWAESVFNHQSVPVAENSYMSTSGFLIAGDNVQAASILLSRFPCTPFKVSILLSRFPYSFQCSLTPFKVFILFSRLSSFFQGSFPFMRSVSQNLLQPKENYLKTKQKLRKVRGEKKILAELEKLKECGIPEENSFAFMFACCGRGFQAIQYIFNSF